jgi:hypothetical protein
MSGHLCGRVSAAEQMFDELTQEGTNVTPQSYSGTLMKLPGGSDIGYRPVSGSGGPAPDVVRSETMKLVAQMLANGFLAGDLLPPGGCQPWKDQETRKSWNVLKKNGADWEESQTSGIFPGSA